ncbi:MAG: hypothetical protein WC960_03345, partial [Bacteroidales bacterium]
MRRFFFITTLLIATISFFAACEKGPQSLDEWGDPDNPNEEQPEPKGESLKLTASILDYLSEARLSLEGNRFSWGEEEQFGLF